MNRYFYGKYAIEVMASVLNKNIPDGPEEIDFDWYGFKAFCEKHCISNIIAYGVTQLDTGIPENILAYFEEIIYQSLAKEARVEIEFNEIADDLEKQCIPHMALKGMIIKHLYPQPDMRSMCDVDILVGDNIDKVAEIMKKHSFSLTESANLHDSYFKKPFLNFELHRSLVDKEITDLFRYFKTGFERAELTNKYKYRYHLNDEDFYIFLIAHLAKHFKRAGSGLRSVADIWIYLKNKQELDFQYINNELKKINLLKFENHIRIIALKWFTDKNIDQCDPVESYIISSGAYGNYTNLELNKFLQSDSQDKNFKNKKFKYFIKVIFPDNDYMSNRYLVLKKYRFLLPLFWFIRIFSTLFKSYGSIKYRLEGVFDATESQQEQFLDFD